LSLEDKAENLLRT